MTPPGDDAIELAEARRRWTSSDYVRRHLLTVDKLGLVSFVFNDTVSGLFLHRRGLAANPHLAWVRAVCWGLLLLVVALLHARPHAYIRLRTPIMVRAGGSCEAGRGGRAGGRVSLPQQAPLDRSVADARRRLQAPRRPKWAHSRAQTSLHAWPRRRLAPEQAMWALDALQPAGSLP